MTADEPLPIDEVLPALLAALRSHPRVVLQAPPGAGKTTRVPLAALRAQVTGSGRIIVLEPRRLAARAAAGYMARLLGEAVGETVGYRIRLESRVGPRTRIELVTEGVLTRMLQDDPSLDGVGLVIFDEFHERSIHADTALAFALEAQALLRPDLRLLVMSATLDTAAVAALLDDAPIIRSEGRAWDVDTIYLDRRVSGPMESAVAARTLHAHDLHDGDILVFLPGAAEIRRTEERLHEAGLPAQTHVRSLYGDLPQQEQDRAIAPSPRGERKIVLATSIAETSLTIEGVRVVIDSGLMRGPRFSPRTGMTRLETAQVSRAAADQRRGRAGRLGPGVCYRMWTEGDHAALLAHRPPEILEADLAPLALQLAAWGVDGPEKLRWIDEPPAASYAQARELLHELDAIDASGRLTEHGRAMSRLAAHPRIAHMLLRAQAMECTAVAADIAALLGERDILRAPGSAADPDIRLRLPLLRDRAPVPHGHTVDRAALHRARRESRHWRQRLRVRDAGNAADDCTPILLAFAYPDRIGRQRGGRGRFVLRAGTAAELDAAHALAAADMIVAAELGGSGRTARVFLAAAIEREDVERHFASWIGTKAEVTYDADADAVRAVTARTLGAIVLDEKSAHDVDPTAVRGAVLDVVQRTGVPALPWTDTARGVRARLAFLHTLEPDDWPDVSDAALAGTLDAWLAPWIDGNARTRVLGSVDLARALLALAGWPAAAELERLAPTHIEVPSGSRIAIDYSDPTAPVLPVRLQEMFGAADTPRIGGGRVPLTLHLLSPARRPVQVTRDLASFWRTTYFDVRKDLRGRYPKHYWPDDPLEAEPTRRTRPRGR
ncbi:MAG TPA: ATP-dependent helicase HrpB [Longimicrobiales bacterium]